MKAVLRLTLTYFSIVPLQKWLAIAGALLVAAALLIHSVVFALFAGLGAVFIVIVPMILGGTSMRFGSSRSTLQLRPGARWKFLAAALLTVCLMTAICVFTLWATTRAGLGPPRRNGGTGLPIPMGTFAIWMWGCFALCWVVSFIASASPKWAMLVGVGCIAFTSRRWAPLAAIGSPLHMVVGAAIVAWLIFMFWYINTRQVKRPAWGSNMSPMGMGENNTGGWYSSLTESHSDSRAMAIKAYLLGTTSQIGFLMAGLISATVILPVYFLQRANPGVVILPVTFLTVFSGVAGGMSYMVARRARMLWLRAGLDRAGLFALGERTAVLAFFQMVLSSAVALGIFSIAVKPDMTARILMFIATQLAYATVLFYFGLSQTRNWTAAGIAACIVFGVGLIAQMIVLLPQTTGISPVIAPAMLGISVLLALLLRQHARKRWLSLDWHLTRPPVVSRQTT